MRKIFCDIETEGLHNPQFIWVCVTKEPHKQPKVWVNLHETENQKEFVDYVCEEPSVFIGHNFLGFDLPVLARLVRGISSDHHTTDTLVCSRLFDSFNYRTHSLDDWGERLGYPKIKFNDFSHLSQEMITYCIRDVEITERLYNLYARHIESGPWQKAIQLEHDTAAILNEARTNGFAFNLDEAKSLQVEIQERVTALDAILQKEFPPRPKAIREIHPTLTKIGKLHSKDFRWLDGGKPEDLGYDVFPFLLIDYVPFNPSSPKQCIDLLWRAGWKPTEKTKGFKKAERNGEDLEHYERYGWTVSEENLNTLPNDAPSAFRHLVEYISLTRKVSTLQEWLDAYDIQTGRIHGTINPIGTWTHRCSHVRPNQGNIPSVPHGLDANRPGAEYNSRMRALWKAADGQLLVGVDAEGIQLRVLAHYMGDESFTQALVSGKKEDETDVHSLNRVKLGRNLCKSRDDAKTFIYSWVLGASAPKTAAVLHCSVAEAVIARQNFLDGYPGLKKIKEELIPIDAARKFMVGLDGRKVICDSAHKMLAGYLQNGEAIIMKWAMRLWYNKLKREKIPFKLVDFVHDEWQTETPEMKYAEYIKAVQIWAIEKAGVDLGVKCPLAGSGSIGLNWLETH